jgi:hypothetical protein
MDEMTTREIGDMIEHLNDTGGMVHCKAHPFVVAGEIKALRLAEKNLKLSRITIGIGVSILVSVWIKGDVSGVVGKVLDVVIMVASAGQ